MTESRMVYFVEGRQIRRNHKTVQWKGEHTYPYDKEMDDAIAMGHARFVEPEPAKPAKVSAPK
jgi:hypothetical protein